MKKSLFYIPILIGLAALACSGTLTGIVGAPVYVCPTPVVVTPIPLPTFPPMSGYPTPLPLPTALPALTVTPYVIRPPDAFYRGDAIFTRSPQSARFRLLNVTAIHTLADRTVAVWEIEISNLSASAYEVFPAYQSFVSQLIGGTTAIWGATADAAVEAGLSLTYEAVSLESGETRVFTLAGFIPYGAVPDRVTFMLNPNMSDEQIPQLPGSNALVWRAEANPYCAGAIADPPAGVLPAP